MSDSFEDDLNPKKRGLGRGLNALFDDDEGSEVNQSSSAPVQNSGQKELPIEFLRPGNLQPRQDFDDQALDTLASSIKAHGILQPILVRSIDGSDNNYEIMAGERRWRAAQLAQLVKVPVLIQDINDNAVLEIALIENLQREDLNPIEEAQGYARLQLEFGQTQEQVADSVGKSRSHVGNLLRLLNLPEEIQNHVRSGELSMGHARALLATENPQNVMQKILTEGLSVREAENLAYGKISENNDDSTTQVEQDTHHSPVPKAAKAPKDADTLALEKELSDALGMRVSIDKGSDYKSGYVRVDFKSLDQLDEILARFSNVSDTVRLMN